MIDLDDAWAWYITTREQVKLFGRLSRKHWEKLPWDGELGEDDKLKTVEAEAIVKGSSFCLDHLDDFGVLILFSVFESVVRAQVLSEVEDEKSRLRHALIVQIVTNATDEIEHGSFHRLLQVLKGLDSNQIEEVNQVRRYRNWVAHGRRTAKPDAVDPDTAFRRLKGFLDVLGIGSGQSS
jgi:hypothetical protein